jgi:putative transposase
MLIEKAYVVKLKTTREHRAIFRKISGCSRFVYNHFLAIDIEREKKTTYTEKCHTLTELKTQLPWLSECPSQVLQQTLSNLESAWERFFKGTSDKPTFKKRRHGEYVGFRFPQGFKIDNRRIFLPKLGWFRFFGKFGNKHRRKNQRKLQGQVRSITVTWKGDGWYASILTKQDIPNPVDRTKENLIGIDLGLKDFAVLSDGTKIPSQKFGRKHNRRIRFEQRHLSRKKEGSRRWNRQSYRLARWHRKVANCRKDFLHKLSTDIAKNHGMAVVEDLNIVGMVKNHNLARSISDSGWRMFTSMLEYKLVWTGGELRKVGRFFPSSKKCSRCGNVLVSLGLKERVHVCPNCCTEMDRDWNAAVNILEEGIAGGQPVLACGGRKFMPRRQESLAGAVPMKQEPSGKGNLIQTRDNLTGIPRL